MRDEATSNEELMNKLTSAVADETEHCEKFGSNKKPTSANVLEVKSEKPVVESNTKKIVLANELQEIKV